MAIDALTIAAILILVVITGVIVRICTMDGNGCGGANEYFARLRRDQRKEGGAE
ncbi:MAG: hypothetical protein R3308_03775 [Thiohalobacterales bacterium]|nr:hypothetical protein [Thiohalobacterales bacterium]